jgi:hypothetical protein
MKRIPFFSTILFAFFCLSMLSCEIIIGPDCCGEPPLPPKGKMEGYFEADGWHATSVKAVVSNGRINITGHDGSLIQFSIEATEVGRYEINPSADKNVAIFIPENNENNLPPYTSAYLNFEVVGEVDIIAIDKNKKTITGRFSCLVGRRTDESLPVDATFNEIPYVETSNSAFSGTLNDSIFSAAIIGGREQDGRIKTHFLKSNGEMIELTFTRYMAPGTYSMGPTNGACITAAGDYCAADSGSITIVEHDMTLKRISGTFSFTSSAIPLGEEKFTVEDASFVVYY